MSTVYEEGREAGYHEGYWKSYWKNYYEGYRESIIKVFLLQAKEKFQTVPKGLDKRLRSASTAQLDDWLVQLMHADCLNAVFDASTTALEEHEQKGIRKGKVETFLLLAQAKFPTVPKSLSRRLRSASLAQLDDWLVRLVSADSLDAVFEAPAKG